jgi:hypothetical protein
MLSSRLGILNALSTARNLTLIEVKQHLSVNKKPFCTADILGFSLL